MKNTPWEPVTDLDRELIAVGQAFFAASEPRPRVAWHYTQHCIDRWQERFGAAAGRGHPSADLENPKLRQAGTKELHHIRAQCPAHAGDGHRKSTFFVLPDPSGGSISRVFVADDLLATDGRFNARAGRNYLVITCFPLRAFNSPTQANGHDHQKQLRLRRAR